MQVKDIMTGGVECISPAATVSAAAQLMKSHDVGSIPVCGDNDKLVGMITDRDVAVRCVAEGRDPQSVTVDDIMTPEITFCRDDQLVSDAAAIMEKRKIRRLVVINKDKRLVGIVSLGDVAVRTHDDAMCTDALEAVSSPV